MKKYIHFHLDKNTHFGYYTHKINKICYVFLIFDYALKIQCEIKTIDPHELNKEFCL